ncbi:MAG TPA: hypothetical protein VF066_18065 [Thermoleophilaceae bacterium]
MRFRFIYALVAALSACMLLFGAAIATGAPGNGNGDGNANANGNGQANADANANANGGGGGSGSTATSGPGNSSQGCDGTHHSDTGNGANQGGPYDETCDGSPSGNGNGNGQATGKPCAGCVGNADDKNPGFANGKGQMPNGTDHNKGYECDKNHGIGRSNPAHTGCVTTTVTPPPDCPAGDPKCCPEGDPKCSPSCPQGDPKCSPSCPQRDPKCPPSCPQGDPKCPESVEKCPPGSTKPECTTPTPTTSSTPTPTPQQLVLGEQVAGTTPEVAKSPASTPESAVLGERSRGKSPAKAPAAAQQARPATTTRKLPFTGTDGIAVLLAGALMLLAGVGLRRLAEDRM